MHFFISAGEASGDIHAAELISELRRINPDATFTFLGGDLMAAAAGRQPLIHIRNMAYMGFVDVARHLPDVIGNLRKAKATLLAERPDALIIVDYPSFNLKLAETASRAGIKVFGYISPKVWAWKEGRLKKMKRLLTHLYSILPFEAQYFAKKNFSEVTYVGNPSREEVDRKLADIGSRADFCLAHGLDPDKKLLALLPGSRVGEIKANLPIMAAVAARHSNLQAVVAGAPAIDSRVYRDITHLPVIADASFELMKHAQAALVTSGTATLECALLSTPQVACYRANGSRIAYEIFKRILKIPFVTLPNLISGREIIAELLVHQCTVESVDSRLTPLLDRNSTPYRTMMADYRELRRRLGTEPAAASTAAHIIKSLE